MFESTIVPVEIKIADRVFTVRLVQNPQGRWAASVAVSGMDDDWLSLEDFIYKFGAFARASDAYRMASESIVPAVDTLISWSKSAAVAG